MLIAAVYDTTDKASSSDIADWLVSNVQDPLARVEGVGVCKSLARNTLCASGLTRPNWRLTR
ncbi:hypothetical protein ACVV38_12950 [Escherichia coli]